MRTLRPLASVYVPQYRTHARFLIDEQHPSAKRHLVVQYARTKHGAFSTAIPDDWSNADVLRLILWPPKNRKAPYPAWEVPARAFGRPELFRWWKG
jgi:hypothetical protein